MYRSKFRDYYMWVIVTLMQVASVIGMACVVHLIMQWAWGVSFIIASAIWVGIFFFAQGINMFTVGVADFHGAVLTNRLRSFNQPVNDEEILNLLPTKSLEEIGPGVHAKWPWQNPSYIDLRREITVRKKVTTYSKDQIQLTADYVLVFAALRGYLCNLVRNSPVEAQDILVAGTQSFVIEQISSMNQQEVFNKLAGLKTNLATYYRGDDVASTPEKQAGLSATNLTLESVTRGAKFQEAAESVEIAARHALAVEKLVTAGRTAVNPISGRQALNAVLANENDAELLSIDITGLEGLRSVGGDFLGNLSKSSKRKQKGGD